jgi:hypothetical protein
MFKNVSQNKVKEDKLLKSMPRECLMLKFLKKIFFFPIGTCCVKYSIAFLSYFDPKAHIENCQKNRQKNRRKKSPKKLSSNTVCAPL